MKNYIINRLKERSTWAGAIALASACGAVIDAALAEHMIAAGLALTGLIGIVTKDKDGAPANKQDGKETPDHG